MQVEAMHGCLEPITNQTMCSWHGNTILLSFSATVSDDEAMDKLGYNVTVSITNVTTQGPPATGKTSVIDLAMGRPPAGPS